MKGLDKSVIPAAAMEAIRSLIKRTNLTVEELEKSKAKRTALASRLREAMGICPKAESFPSSPEKTDKPSTENVDGDQVDSEKRDEALLPKYRRFKENRKQARAQLKRLQAKSRKLNTEKARLRSIVGGKDSNEDSPKSGTADSEKVKEDEETGVGSNNLDDASHGMVENDLSETKEQYPESDAGDIASSGHLHDPCSDKELGESGEAKGENSRKREIPFDDPELASPIEKLTEPLPLKIVERTSVLKFDWRQVPAGKTVSRS